MNLKLKEKTRESVSAVLPIGEGIVSKVSKKQRINVILAIIFIMGVIITILEPDLQVMAQQVPSVPNSILLIVVTAGVGIFLVLAVLRIFLQI